MDYREMMLAAATPEHRSSALDVLEAAEAADGGAWSSLQGAVLERIGAYLDAETAKDTSANVGSHECGGHLRVAFPHLRARWNHGVIDHLDRLMAARRAYTIDGGTPDDGERLYHGYPDEAEVHHEIETFLYFQLPLLFQPGVDRSLALESIEDVAHHIGNWASGAPDWYDWERHEFVSTYLGTKHVRDEPPHDYQEANHFRFIAVALATHLLTGEQRYLDLCVDYADRWCRHIEAHAGEEPIPCSILPETEEGGELGFTGIDHADEGYQVFYSTVAPNTAHDIVVVLQDLYRLTGRERYRRNAEAVIDQFFDHGRNGRPVLRHSGGEWAYPPFGNEEHTGDHARMAVHEGRVLQDGGLKNLLARIAMRHDVITGADRYADAIHTWAEQLDPATVVHDQGATDLMVAAHYYTGDPAFLQRAYELAIRIWAAVEGHSTYHMCSTRNRQGSKFLFVWLYQPLLGGCSWATRGDLPVRQFRHEFRGEVGLPPTVRFRTWRESPDTLGFQATNAGSTGVEWHIEAPEPLPRLADVPTSITITTEEGPSGNRLQLGPNQIANGRIDLE